MMKHSAGILAYKIENSKIKVLLCHMGGPYWCNIEDGAWSIPKGEVKDEKTIEAALREFNEETGFEAKKDDLTFLGSKKQYNNKLVIIFIVNNDYDVTNAKSNTFKKEWPKGSGIIQEFPEMDRAAWFEIEEAKRKILKGQIYFLTKLTQFLNQTK